MTPATVVAASGAAALASVCLLSAARAADPDVGAASPLSVAPGEPAPEDGEPDDAGAEPGRDVIVAPIPFSNPTIDTGIGVVSALLFSADPGSEASFVGAGGLASTNGSWAVGLGASVSFREDRWRTLGFAGYARLRYDLFGVGADAGEDGIAVEIEQTGWVVAGQVARRVAPNVFIGMRARYLSNDIAPTLADAPDLGLPTIGTTATAGLVGPTFEADFRDDGFSPRKGWRVTASGLQSFDEPLGNLGLFGYRRLSGTFDTYLPVGDTSVLALRLAGCHVDGSAPFFDLCRLGGDDAFRGYAIGKFIDRSLASVQAEIRAPLWRRLGWAAFGGLAVTGDGFDDFTTDATKPAGGVGLRYRLSRKFKLDFSADLAVGEDGPVAYVYVGQRF